MTDPLAHLYAEDGSGFDLEDDAPELPTTIVNIEDLHQDHGDEAEEISDQDLDELTNLVRTDSSDRNLVELGLARWIGDELDLSPAGLEVLGRIIDEKHPGLRRA